MAAKDNRIHVVVIDDASLAQGDEFLQKKISGEKKKWKQWSAGGNSHSFLLVVVSPRIHYAAPNAALRQLARWFESCIAEESLPDVEGNFVSNEWLYLRNPQSGKYYKFRVNLDFFASSGDKRWWHDHRFPGGLAFTLNSVGHMARYKQWYSHDADPTAWAVKTAMMTIEQAHNHPQHGKATQLRNLSLDGKTLKGGTCPFRNIEAIPPRLRDKDWSVYSGRYHTDHAVRDEFFDGSESPPIGEGSHALDFSYLMDSIDQENVELMAGVEITEEAFFQEVGNPGEHRRFSPEDEESPTPDMREHTESPTIPADEEAKILRALEVCQGWLDED